MVSVPCKEAAGKIDGEVNEAAPNLNTSVPAQRLLLGTV